jgi:hypothetical protein
VKTYTKNELIAEFHNISALGWVKNARSGNNGGIGNTLEDLLGITENNLPIPNAAEWELKAQRINTASLITLFHIEPSPRACKFVPDILLKEYGWRHKEAGKKYPNNEMSFRQTIHGAAHSDRGFIVKIDRASEKIVVSFDASKVAARHAAWLEQISSRAGLGELEPQPYWGFDDLRSKAGTKLLNCFYAQAEVKKCDGEEFYRYSKVTMLQKFSFDEFLRELENGAILIDFDARTGHNHGTKFRMRQNHLPNLYERVTTIIG